MLVLTNPVRLYGKKVITDLISRRGAPDQYTTPFYGMESVFLKWSGYKDVSELPATLDYICELEPDFNADNSQPLQHSLDEFDPIKYAEEEAGERLPMYKATESDPNNFRVYYRRLEDINEEYLKNYIGYIAYRMCYQAKNSRSIGGLNRLHQVQPTLVDVNEDEESELADTVVFDNTDRITEAEIEYANDHLGYTLKRLHNLSKQIGIHIISYIGAYLRAKAMNDKKRQSGSIKRLTSNDVITCGVYLCDGHGNATKRIEVKNKNKHAIDAYNWIMGLDNTYSAYIKDYYSLLHYCDVLSIDLINDDTLPSIGSDIVDKLIIKTVTPNKQYNEQIFKALKDNNPTIVKKTNELSDIIEATVSLVDEACSDENANNVFYNIVNQYVNYTPEDARALGVNLYVGVMRMMYPTFNVDPAKISWREGYLHYSEELVILDACYINPKETYEENRFLISELGVVVKLSTVGKLLYMFTRNALSNLYKINHPSDDNKFDTWC